jgi:site-specific DNA recombinase
MVVCIHNKKNMKKYFGYIRVSTVRQSEKGASLAEQKIAIEAYAAKQGLFISEWFEETETAAKVGRRLFRRMLARLIKGEAVGVVIHKVDRGARNLADWAELGSLMDQGIPVHFAHEALDLSSRGGRLSADIQAVVAADYIRNLRQEVKKGMYGRLRQGYFPFGAPLGYCNNGKGMLKTIDPVQGPLVKEAFTLYASGRYSLSDLLTHMTAKGLRGIHGQRMIVSNFSKMLNNPFYYGLITVRGETFVGKHEPLISKRLFDECREVAEGRTFARHPTEVRSEFLFRRFAHCASCGRALYGERQKGHVYYRCHSGSCKGTCVREDHFRDRLKAQMSQLPHRDALTEMLQLHFELDEEKKADTVREREKSWKIRTANALSMKERLIDLLIDGTLPKESYETRMAEVNNTLLVIEAEKSNANEIGSLYHARAKKFLEVVNALYDFTENDSTVSQRDVLRLTVSNLTVYQKNIEFTWEKPFQVLFEKGTFCGDANPKPYRKTIQNVTPSDEAHTFTEKLLDSLMDWDISDL